MVIRPVRAYWPAGRYTPVWVPVLSWRTVSMAFWTSCWAKPAGTSRCAGSGLAVGAVCSRFMKSIAYCEVFAAVLLQL